MPESDIRVVTGRVIMVGVTSGSKFEDMLSVFFDLLHPADIAASKTTTLTAISLET